MIVIICTLMGKYFIVKPWIQRQVRKEMAEILVRMRKVTCEDFEFADEAVSVRSSKFR